MKRGSRKGEIVLYLRLKCEPKIKKKKIPTLGMWEARENTICSPILDRGVLGQENGRKDGIVGEE